MNIIGLLNISKKILNLVSNIVNPDILSFHNHIPVVNTLTKCSRQAPGNIDYLAQQFNSTLYEHQNGQITH
jgi:hypothetical protein